MAPEADQSRARAARLAETRASARGPRSEPGLAALAAATWSLIPLRVWEVNRQARPPDFHAVPGGASLGLQGVLEAVLQPEQRKFPPTDDLLN